MKQLAKGICLVLMAGACNNTVYAQHNDKSTELLQLMPKRTTISSANFSQVEVVDTRFDTVQLGFIQKGGLNRKENLVLTQPLKNELASIAGKMLREAQKQEGTLLINIRNFNIGEVSAGLTEKGTFTFNAGFYIKQGAGYNFLFAIDSTVTVKAGSELDVTTKLLDTVPEILAGYLKQAAGFDLSKAGTKQYTAYEIEHIVELEKKEIPVYSLELPKKGLYTSYEDFKNNRPSREDVIIQNKKGFSRPFIFEMKENGKKGVEIKHKYYYVVCDGEKMFVSNAYGLYPLTKQGNDFCFTGIGKDDMDVGTAALAGALLGVVGGIAASKNDLALFEFRIDHLTGNFIAVKKLKD
ncbi:hypothetical protein [Longitalea arenae]|uniref:hypothetical protein n=1 Tax=Longitalea arenae TaxID=2812558 RepID=UPI00196789C2|nr:hypothetical protein [Longitalea arenae]